MRTALHAEWTKLCTLAEPWWLLVGAVTLTIALGDEVGQAPISILAVEVVSGEHSTGMIRSSLTAVPRRFTLLAAKVLTLVGVVTLGGTVAVLGSLVANRFNQSLTSAQTPTTGGGAVVHLTLIVLLSFGVAVALRSSATSIAVILGLLYVLPLVSLVIANHHWQHVLDAISPTSARLAVVAAWATGSLLVGSLMSRLRDRRGAQ